MTKKRTTDPVFIEGPFPEPMPSGLGALDGHTLAVKDIFDLAGHVTGAGNPKVRELRAPADADAWAVARLRAAGAAVIGKTHTDEFAYAMNGENVHYGTPPNPNAPGRIPGGSSSGSASAVAAGRAAIALASDTGGSVRLPAAYCGLIGLRTTHGRLPLAGVHTLAPSLDTIGWFASDMDLYGKVASVMFGTGPETPFRRLLVADDPWDHLVGEEERHESQRMVDAAARRLPIAGHVTLAPKGMDDWRRAMRIIQAHEIWKEHETLLDREDLEIGPEIAQRIEAGRTVSAADYAEALAIKATVAAQVSALIPEDCALVFPTAPGPAPVTGMSGPELESYRLRSISMLCIAGLSGLPQLSLPLGSIAGLPFGISLLGAQGSDERLLATGDLLLSARATFR